MRLRSRRTRLFREAKYLVEDVLTLGLVLLLALVAAIFIAWGACR